MVDDGETRPAKSEDDWRLFINHAALLFATLIVSVAFFSVIQIFLQALVLAAIFAVLAAPLYEAILPRVGGRAGAASGLTLLICVFAVIAPAIGIGILAAQQAADLLAGVTELYQTVHEEVQGLKEGLVTLPSWVPFGQEISALIPRIIQNTDGILKEIAGFLSASLKGMINGTASFFLSFFTFLYAIFFFLQMETPIIKRTLRYTGLNTELQAALNDRIMSISEATLKGTLIIGGIQGALGAMGFWITGIPNAIFWGVIMALAAAVPAVGASFITVCGAIYLATQGSLVAAIGLAIWGLVVVGMIDNILRPPLVGRQAQLPDLAIFVSTLGGLAVFGVAGLIFGPVLAGIFFTVWAFFAEETKQRARRA